MLMFELLGGGKILTLNLTSNLTATRTGGSITFTVVALGGASPYAGAFITFYKKNSDNSLTTIGTGTTNASGIVNLTYTLSGTETPQNFYAYFAGNTTWNGNSSNILSISVEPVVSFNYFTATSGTGTWVVPANVYKISVLTIGAGGASRPQGTSAAQKGGGGGAVAIRNNVSVTPGQSFTYRVDSSSDIYGGLTALYGVCAAEAGWQDSSIDPYRYGDTGSASFSGDFGGRGGQGGTGYMYTSGSVLTNYYPYGGGGGGAGGVANNSYYTGTGESVGFNGPPTAVGPGGSNPTYTVAGAYRQPGGGNAGIWYVSNPTATVAGGSGAGWIVSSTGVMTISYSANSTVYGWGRGGTGSAWREDFSPPAIRLGGSGFLQIMWGNDPAAHVFPDG